MPAHPDDRERPTTPTVWAALVTVYIVWGTTYSAIRIVDLGWAFLDESISLRTVIAGATVLAAVAIIVASPEEPSSPEATSGGELAEDRGDLGERDLSLEGAGDAQDHGLAERRLGDLQADG